MKIIKTASGKKKIKISKKEWQAIGKQADWDENSLSGRDPVNELTELAILDPEKFKDLMRGHADVCEELVDQLKRQDRADNSIGVDDELLNSFGSGKKKIKISKSKWKALGKQAGWEDESDERVFTGDRLKYMAFIRGFLPFENVMNAETDAAAEEISYSYRSDGMSGWGSSDWYGPIKTLLSDLGIPQPTDEERMTNAKNAQKMSEMMAPAN